MSNHGTTNKLVQYCLDKATTAQDQDQLAVADALREVAVNAEALLEEQQVERAEPSAHLIGEPLVELRQDPDQVPCCPECGEVHQHYSEDPDGRWGCACNDETYFLSEWLFWAAAHTVCQHCGIPPSGDPDGLYCGTHDGHYCAGGYCCGADAPVQPAEWIQRNAAEDEPAATQAGNQADRINKLLLDRYGDQGIDQTVARLIQRVDQLALDQQAGYDHLANTQAADFATLMDKLDCDPMMFVGLPKPDPTEETPLVGCTLPYYELVLFEGPHAWHVRHLLGGEAALERRLGRLEFPDKQMALEAIEAAETKLENS